MKINPVIIIAFSAILIISCDDNESWTEKRSQELSKVYRDETLKITFNGQEVQHKAVGFNTTNLNTSTFALRYLIPGENPLEIKDVPLEEIQEKPGSYSFNTSSSNDSRKIDITGTIGDKMEIDVQFKITSPIMGKWSPIPNKEKGPLEFRIVPAPGNETINMHGIFQNKIIPLVGDEGFNAVIKDLGALLFSIIQISLDLQESSELIAHCSIMGGTPSESEAGMVKYNVLNDKVFAAVAIDELLFPSPETKSSSFSNTEALINLLQYIYQGIPIPISLSEDNKALQVRITKEMMVPYLDAAMELLAPKLAELEINPILSMLFGITKENIPLFLSELVRVIKESNEFDIQFNLQPAPDTQFRGAPSKQELIEFANQLKYNLK